jgi:hypothetical protein
LKWSDKTGGNLRDDKVLKDELNKRNILEDGEKGNVEENEQHQ